MTGDDFRRRRYFLAALLLQVLVFGYLILARRFPKGHDTQSVFLLQHLFLSQDSAGLPLWMPSLAHGIVSTWFANLQAGLLQNVLLLTGAVPAGTPMLPIFYAGLFLEDLILLIGVWRLGARYYRTPAAQFFVAVAALGSSVWISNIYWNHRLVYGAPLAVSLLLDVLETGSRPKFFLATTLMFLQLTGNAPYIPVFSMLAIGLFLGIHILLRRKRLRLTLPLLRPRAADAAWLAVIAVLFAAVTLSIVNGLGSMSQYHPGRNPDGSVTLDSFLTYPGGTSPLRYLDLLLGLTPSKDFSLYCGLGTLVFAVAAWFLRPGRDLLILTFCLLLIVCFSLGYLSFVGAAGYYAFPPLHFFRYVGLVAPIARLLLILIGGLGFDAFVRTASRGSCPPRLLALAGSVLALAALQAAFHVLDGSSPSGPAASFLRRLEDGLALRGGEDSILSPVLAGAAAAAGLACLMIFRKPLRGNPALLVPLLLVLQGSDVFRWRLSLLRDETVPLDDPHYAVQNVVPMPFISRRSVGKEVGDRAFFGKDLFDAGLSSGTTYDYCDAFLHRDPAWSNYFVTMWSPPVDLLLRARAGRGLAPDGDPPPPFRNLDGGYAKLVGLSEDKLQVFSAAHAAGADTAIAAMLNHPRFQGDVLLLTRAGEPDRPFDESLATRNERLPALMEVLGFSANRVRIEVKVPPSHPEAWLVYADAWHAGWSATVDGSPAAVERANLAYKAVRLHAGRNLVEFRFRAPLRSACSAVLGLLSLFWCVVLAAWTAQLLGVGRLRRRDEAGSSRSSGTGRPAAE